MKRRYLPLLLSLLILALLFRYLFPVLLPFLLAYVITAWLRAPARFLHRVTRLPVFVWILLLLLLTACLLGTLLYFLLSHLLRETGELLLWLYAGDAKGGMLSRIEGTLGFLPPALLALAPYVSEAVSRLLPELLSFASGVLGTVLSMLPGTALSLLFFFAAAFYFARDDGTLLFRLLSRLPPSHRTHAERLWHGVGGTARAYLRAYLALFAIVFSMTLIGFLLLGVRYAALLALLCAVVDLLPLLGVGAVLLPYAAFALVTGKGVLASGVLFLYVSVFLVRSLAEPHLLSRKLGIHPLLSLFCMYGGYRLFGIGMMIASPFLASLALSLFRSYREEGKNEKNKKPLV